MSKVLVLYYSAYGHIEKKAEAVAEGVVAVPGAEVAVRRVPELVPEEIAKRSGMRLNQPAALATVGELANYDAIIIGTPTRFGNMCAQMRSFLDQTGGVWVGLGHELNALPSERGDDLLPEQQFHVTVPLPGSHIDRRRP